MQDETHKRAVHFSVDAGHVSQIGLELVARQETALAELVKNAFDADATRVDISFIVDESSGEQRIEIWDDGSGMSADRLRTSFMVIGTPSKVSEPLSPKYRRTRAGRKGIGRFAAQRLACRLLVRTQTLEDGQSSQLDIDWDEFSPTRELTSISAVLHEGIPKLRPHGTELILSGLRDSWTEVQVKRTYAHLTSLLQPFPLRAATDDKQHDHAPDPGFRVQVFRQQGESLDSIVDPWQLFADASIASFSAKVLSTGAIELQITSERLRIHETTVLERELKAAAGASMTANYFIDNEIPRVSRTAMRHTLKENGGIRVFHNGFRVLPYGEPSDDWAGLDRSDRRRTLLPPHDNSNFLGFVQVDDRTSDGFVEVSSREGFVANQAFADLRKFVYEVVSAVVLRVAEAREKKAKSGGRKKEVVAELREVVDIASRLEQIDADVQDGRASPGDAILEVRVHAQELVARSRLWFDERKSLLKELELLRVLGSMGLAINEFTHEVLLAFASVYADLESVRTVTGDIQQIARVRSTLDSFKAYISFFERAAGASVLARERRPLEIRDVLSEFRTLVEPRLARRQLGRFETVARQPGIFTSALHHSEWMSVLINLATNAFKAIARSGRSGYVLVEAELDQANAQVVVRVSDDGVGIPENVKSRVFDPFFTTFDEATEPDELRGMGLGLSIVRDIVVSSGGTVEVVPATHGFATTFEIRVPATPRESIDELY